MFVQELETTYRQQEEGEVRFPSGASLRPVTGPTGPHEEHWDPNNTGLPLYDTGRAVQSVQLSANFTVKELVTSGGRAATRARISPELVRCLQAIHDAAGKPVAITSGYRSWFRNVEVYAGRTPTKSRHCSGQAADITIAGLTGMQIAKLAIDACGQMIGIGIGGNFAHIDVRGFKARWTYFAGDANRRALGEIQAYRRRPGQSRGEAPAASRPGREAPPIPGRSGTQSRPRGRRPSPSGRGRAKNLVLISGGPGLWDNRDVEHDQSWANYVTPPLLLTDTATKKATFVGAATDVTWLIYKPAYDARFADDAVRRPDPVREIRRQGFSSYVDKLEHQARNRGWRLVWFTSADDLWKRLATFRDPIERVWYWGHARDDLWLTLDHSRSAVAVMPTTAGSVVPRTDIAKHSALKASFGAGRPHRFVGCNTATFAAEWSRVFGVSAEGVAGKVEFQAIHRTGGEPSLVGSATWQRFRAGVRVP